MKLPFDLGIKLVLRLLIPGFLLAMGLYPLLAAIHEFARWGISLENLVILASIVAGWVVIALDQPIYMAFEGRRYWPAWLRRALRSSEKRRLERLLRAEERAYRQQQGGDKVEGERRNLEAWVKIRKFPLNKDGQPSADMPTRLGNLITSYETYPDNRYGADAIFYWYRIWLMLDKDLREELDARQAVADSGLYASAAFTANVVFWSAYAALLPLTARVGRAADFNATLDRHLPTPATVLVIAAAFLVLAWAAYRLSLYPQFQYGETFKSVFDLYERRVDVGRVVGRVATVTHHRPTLVGDRRAQLEVAWRYLHNYRVRCPYDGCEDRVPMPPEAFPAHLETLHGVVSVNDVPAPAPAPPKPVAGFYEESASLQAIERRVRQGRWLLLGLAVAALASGVVQAPLALIASGIAVAATVGEHVHWKRYSSRINTLRTQEAALGVRNVLDPVLAWWKSPRVWLPYVVLLVVGFLVFAAG
jgi:hypothetical protein